MLKSHHILQNYFLFFIRLFLLACLINIFGWLKGVLLFLFSLQTYDFFLQKFFDLESLSPTDFNFVGWEGERQYNLVFGMILEGKNKNGMKKLFYDKGIKFFKRLRQKLTFSLGNYYLKEFPEEEALNQVFLVENNIRTNEEFDDFRTEITKAPFGREQHLFKVYIGENDLDQTFMILQFDHLLGDGMALNCLISRLTDDFDVKNFPPIPEKSKLQKFKNKVIAPFYALHITAMMFFNKTPMTPFKLVKPVSGVKVSVKSPEYCFKRIRVATKKLNVTFNDYFLGIVTAAAKKYSRDNNYHSADSLKCLIPMNLRPHPKFEKDLVMSNESSGVGLNLEFIDNPVEDIKKISATTKIYIKNHIYCEAVNFLNLFSNIFLPFFFSKQIIIQATKNFDFVISNLPGSPVPIKIGGMLMKNLYTFPNSGPHGCFIACLTFMNKLSVNLVVDKSTNCNAKEFIKYIDNEITVSLENLKIE